MKVNREDVVQAALILERWCKEHIRPGDCECPFIEKYNLCSLSCPFKWELEEFLRTRGLKHD